MIGSKTTERALERVLEMDKRQPPPSLGEYRVVTLRLAVALAVAVEALQWYGDVSRHQFKPIGGMRARDALAAIDAAFGEAGE